MLSGTVYSIADNDVLVRGTNHDILAAGLLWPYAPATPSPVLTLRIVLQWTSWIVLQMRPLSSACSTPQRQVQVYLSPTRPSGTDCAFAGTRRYDRTGLPHGTPLPIVLHIRYAVRY